MKIDTGTEPATMRLEDFRGVLPNHKLLENEVQLRTATGERFRPHSFAEVSVDHKGSKAKLRLYLFENDTFPTLIGRSWLRTLAIDINTLLLPSNCNQIPDLNYKTAENYLLKKSRNLTKPGIGRIPNAEARLELNPETPEPKYARARPVAHSMLELMDRVLGFFQEQHIIEKVLVSYWAHQIAVVPRAQGKKVRICGDFKTGINKFIRIDKYPLENLRHALENIGGGERFSDLDISSAFSICR